MNPKLAIGVRRNLETLDADALDPTFVGLDEDSVGPGRHPKHFKAQGRHGHALRQHDHRYPPDDAVAFGPDRKQSPASCCSFEYRNVAQQAEPFEHERLRLLAQHGQPCHRKGFVKIAEDNGNSGFAQHDARAPDRIGENLIVARQASQFGPGFLIQIAERIGRDVGIEPVRLREHHVKGDHGGAEFGQIRDHVRDPRSRPRPLAKLGQAFVVNVDDGNRRLRELGAGIDALERIEGPDPDFLDRRRVGEAQRRKADQEHEAHQPRIPDPSGEPTPPYPQPLHAVSISRPGEMSTSVSLNDDGAGIGRGPHRAAGNQAWLPGWRMKSLAVRLAAATFFRSRVS